MGWLTERTTYHSTKGKFCRKGDACTVTKDGNRYKIVIQHRRLGGKAKTLENTERGREKSAEVSGRRGRWLQLERSGKPMIQRPQKCKDCDAPATTAVIWADGRAYVPACDDHVDGVKGRLEDVVGTRPIPQKGEE